MKIAVVNGIISWPDSVSEKSELFIYFRFPSWLQSLWSGENWIVGVAGRGEKINQSQCEYSGHPIAFNPTIQFSLDRRWQHFFCFHKFDFLWIISPYPTLTLSRMKTSLMWNKFKWITSRFFDGYSYCSDIHTLSSPCDKIEFTHLSVKQNTCQVHVFIEIKVLLRILDDQEKRGRGRQKD